MQLYFIFIFNNFKENNGHILLWDFIDLKYIIVHYYIIRILVKEIDKLWVNEQKIVRLNQGTGSTDDDTISWA